MTCKFCCKNKKNNIFRDFFFGKENSSRWFQPKVLKLKISNYFCTIILAPVCTPKNANSGKKRSNLIFTIFGTFYTFYKIGSHAKNTNKKVKTWNISNVRFLDFLFCKYVSKIPYFEIIMNFEKKHSWFLFLKICNYFIIIKKKRFVTPNFGKNNVKKKQNVCVKIGVKSKTFM